MKKKTPAKKPLYLHNLIVALSFWGTAVRTLLFSFLAVAVFAISLTEVGIAGFDQEVMVLIYVLGSFLLLDFGYVMIARSYPLKPALDVVSLLLADIFLALLYIAPSVVVNSHVNLTVNPLAYVIFIPLVVLSLRMLTAFLYGGRQR